MSATPILFLALFGALLLAPKAGCQEKAPLRKIDTLVSMDELDNSQKLKPDNIVSVRILEDKREALQQGIARTGQIVAPYVGLIKAEGQTCRELAFQIKSELEKSFFKQATVLVTFDAVGENFTHCVLSELPSVVAFGTIAKQGKYDFEGIPEHKLSALIKRAGGFTAKDTIPKIRVIRKTAQGNQTIVIDGKALLNKEREADLVLQANDVMIVE
jgi:protein involved in polysaccharide export with SLBB domain